MLSLLLPSVLLFAFGIFNLLGIAPAFVPQFIVFAFIGCLLYMLIRRIGLHFFQINASLFYLLMIAALIFTSIVGQDVRGSKRWIDLYFFHFQASEFFKIFFIIFFADRFSRFVKTPHQFKSVLKIVGLFLIPAVLIFRQPDLGSTLVYVAIFGSLLLFSPVKKRYVLMLIILTVFFLPLGSFFLRDYQRERLMSFMSPEIDTLGSSYNRTQAMIAIGSGTIFGRGLGQGTQSLLSFLPENHTDFAFSSLVEQFGFFGGSVVLILYAFMALILGKAITHNIRQHSQQESFRLLVLVGFFSMFFFSVFLNIGMNLGILPITGITLPFISYGGSSLVMMIFAMGFLPL